MRLTGVLLAVVLAGGVAARAQTPASDPIGALLDRPAATEVEDEPGVPRVDPGRGGAAAPPPAVANAAPSRASGTGEPVRLEETGRSPDAPLGPNDLAYEGRIRASIAAAQRFQGAMDGGWVLTAGGEEAFALQISDRGDGALEAAWRDLRRPGGLSASGFVDRIESQGPDLTLRFDDEGRPVEAALHAAPDGSWTGEIELAGRRQPARLRRRLP